MLNTSFSNIKVDYYTSNEKIYSSNNFCYKISNVKNFDAEKFSKWMKDSFESSNFKSLTALADAVKSNKATISRLYNGTSQTLTNKPSQPNRDLVLRLANAFNDDVNKVLMLAGYAPTGDYENDLSAEILKDLRISLQGGGKGISQKQKQEIINLAVTIARGVIAKGDVEDEGKEDHSLQTKVDLDLTGEEQPAYSLPKENETVKVVKKTGRLKI